MPAILSQTESKYLSFRLGAENYAIEILKVREIIGLMEITAVPRTAAHVRGVINLRGKIVTVLDMREKLGLPRAELGRENCIITVMVESAGGPIMIGILIDAVNEVLQLEGSQIEAMPSLGDDARLGYISGLAKVQSRVVILLDIEKIVAGEDLEAIRQIPEAGHA